MTVETVVAGAVAAGGASIFGAVVNGLWNRRKLGAEATEAITRAASGVVRDLETDNTRLRQEAAVLRTDRDRDHVLIRGLQRQVEDLVKQLELITDSGASQSLWIQEVQKTFVAALAEHVEFDRELVARLRAHGESDLPEPPPLPTLPTPPNV